MIVALDNVSKSSLADNFLNFVAVAYLVTLLESVIPFLVIVTIIYKSLKLSWKVFNAARGNKPNFFKLFYFCFFKLSETIIRY